jgi:hypothetical protein
MNGMPNAVKLGLLALLAGGGLVGCGSGVSANGGATPQTVQPVDDAVATKAQTSCWFKRERGGAPVEGIFVRWRNDWTPGRLAHRLRRHGTCGARCTVLRLLAL